jgi:hypothetical protein
MTPCDGLAGAAPLTLGRCLACRALRPVFKRARHPDLMRKVAWFHCPVSPATHHTRTVSLSTEENAKGVLCKRRSRAMKNAPRPPILSWNLVDDRLAHLAG